MMAREGQIAALKATIERIGSAPLRTIAPPIDVDLVRQGCRRRSGAVERLLGRAHPRLPNPAGLGVRRPDAA